MDTLVTQFLDSLQHERHRSSHTIAGYGQDLQLFIAYAQRVLAHPSWADIDSDIIRNWVITMMDAGRQPTTINRRLSTLRAFFRYAVKQGVLTADPAYIIRGPKKGKPLPQFVPESDMERLLTTLPWDDSFAALRARTIILTFYSTGMRLSELLTLDDSSVNFRTMVVKVHGKRDKDRLIPFGSDLATALQAYISARDASLPRTTTALFVTDRGERMKPYQVRRLVQAQLARVTTMKKRSPHVLRHTFATAMLNNNAHLEAIKTLLGHQSVATTEIYTHTTFEQLQRVYDNTHPRGGSGDDEQ